ncbi:acetyltransferase [Anatilimnocola aggregata]|uniref:Acetyltransferase n=1 Tax=Anatilimnocola aggregata TaxID=2528021 RepID=A0A517YBL2_9BACT|nr:GNAT family N-acetyltransferase [Anatilimnocola aggregata]QDU27604.1 acetyltransferase [Anatilimnocola aggregata]
MLEILPLAARPDTIEQLAAWHFGEWGKLNPTNDIAARSLKLQRHLQEHAIPTTFVGVEGTELLGSASLVEQDLDLRPEYTPWLASVFVAPEHRARGIGRQLVERIMAEAESLGVTKLYLFTFHHERFYASLGWHRVEGAVYRGEPITIMAWNPGN